MQASDPESIVLRFVDSINAGDLDGIAALTGPKYTFTDTAGDVFVVEGNENVKASWDAYLSAYPEYKILVQHVLRGGNGVAIIGRTTGSHMSPDVEHEELILWVAEILNGLVAGWRIYSTHISEGT